MKEHPILFSAPMIRSVIKGEKFQTRRAVRKQFAPDAEPSEVPATSPEGWQISGHSGLWWDDSGACFDDAIRCPYGQPGDRLWVRETFAIENTCGYEGDPGIDPPEGPYKWYGDRDYRLIPRYRATAPETELMIAPSEKDEIGMRWTPSIHMPRWASRILLEVTGVRVERLGDIRESDAIAEGTPGGHGSIPGYNYSATPVEHYRHLWESINGKGSWKANPWVWVIEFKRIDNA